MVQIQRTVVCAMDMEFAPLQTIAHVNLVTLGKHAMYQYVLIFHQQMPALVLNMGHVLLQTLVNALINLMEHNASIV